MSKYGDFPGPYFPTFGLNVGKYGPEKSPYLDTFHRVGEVLIRASGGGGAGGDWKRLLKLISGKTSIIYLTVILETKF